ncbi:hypothetical protein B0H66DRAFT_559705 [Apodospora peruviana]|uniref:Uncharacterized protein n=1 Tax=Apodospora peruviana TaxID=516989 RepID=A0AAE0M1W8_9PEZI|nr:hypothetical protein B0H66DRAFT_559705 [Apodospora peruviana]
MHPSTITTTLFTLLLSSLASLNGANAATIPNEQLETRQGNSVYVAFFQGYPAWDCAGPETLGYSANSSDVGDNCYPFKGTTQSVSVTRYNAACHSEYLTLSNSLESSPQKRKLFTDFSYLVTVYGEPGCTDQGTPLGLGGCFSHAPAIQGWKVTCDE